MCNHHLEHLNLASDSRFKSLLKAVANAFKKLHKKGSYDPKHLKDTKEYQEVIIQTNTILERSLQDNVLSEGMLESLENDIFYFSGIKTHAQLLEASRQLMTADKKLKSFTQFSKDIESLTNTYNQSYLEAEYQFAKGSVLMAGRWENLKDSDRYYLQYRTANDNKVRDTHRALHDITLKMDDAFWKAYYPPNGWRCRCTAVQVLAATNELSNSKKSHDLGKAATTQIGKNGKNKLALFRFNPGLEKVVFPPTHPYHKVTGVKQAKKELDGLQKNS